MNLYNNQNDKQIYKDMEWIILQKVKIYNKK